MKKTEHYNITLTRKDIDRVANSLLNLMENVDNAKKICSSDGTALAAIQNYRDDLYETYKKFCV